MWFKKRSLKKRVKDLEEDRRKIYSAINSLSEELCQGHAYHEVRQQLGIDLSIGFELYLRIKNSIIGADDNYLKKEGYKYYGLINHYNGMSIVARNQHSATEVWARPSKTCSQTPHFGPSPGDG